MKKRLVIGITLLLVFLTTNLYAQKAIEDYNGYDWNKFTRLEKVTYLLGFINSSRIGSIMLYSFLPSFTKGFLKGLLQTMAERGIIDSMPEIPSENEISNIFQSDPMFTFFDRILDLSFRVGTYELELNVFYSSPSNLSTSIFDAIFITNWKLKFER